MFNRWRQIMQKLPHPERKHLRQQHWDTVITQWENSGKDVLSFCEGKQISTSSFYHWRNSLRPKFSKGGKSVCIPNQAKHKDNRLFVPIQITPSSNSADKEFTLHYPNGCYLSLKGDFDATILSKINQAMGV